MLHLAHEVVPDNRVVTCDRVVPDYVADELVTKMSSALMMTAQSSSARFKMSRPQAAKKRKATRHRVYPLLLKLLQATQQSRRWKLKWQLSTGV